MDYIRPYADKRWGEYVEEKRLLGTLASVPLVTGAMLGVGIFLVPTQIAVHLPSPLIMYLTWALVGLFCWMGGLCYAELGARYPRAGGDVVYLRELYGGSVAQLLGWVIFAGIFTGSMAALAVPLCQFQIPVLLGDSNTIPWTAEFAGISIQEIVACLIILLLTCVNILGLRLSTAFQAAFTFVPMGVYIIAAIGSIVLFEPVVESPASTIPVEFTLSGFGIAVGGVYFAFSGWNQAAYVAGEIHRPSRTLPRTVTISVLGVTLLYILLNVSFVHHLGFGYLQTVGFAEVGTETAGQIGGDVWQWWMNLFILLGLVGSLNGTILCGARVAYAMAKEGGLSSHFHQYSKRNQPVRALILQAVIACVYVMTGTFGQLLELVSLAMMLVAVITVIGVWKKSSEPTEYRAPLIAPYVFVIGGGVVCLIMIYNTIVDQNWVALMGGGLLVVSLLVAKIPFETSKILSQVRRLIS